MFNMLRLDSNKPHGKAKSVQQNTDDAGAAPAPETPVADDGRRRLRAKRARPAEAVPDEIDKYGPRSPSSGESEPEPDAWLLHIDVSQLACP